MKKVIRKIKKPEMKPEIAKMWLGNLEVGLEVGLALQFGTARSDELVQIADELEPYYPRIGIFLKHVADEANYVDFDK